MEDLVPDRPQRGPDCPSTLTLEALFARERVSPETAAHAQGCTECSGYLRRLQTGQGAFLAARPFERFERQLDRAEAAKGQRRFGLWAKVLALPAVALCALAVVQVAHPRGEDAVRIKGEALHVYFERAGAAPEPVTPDLLLRAGDRLRFAYAAPSPGWITILDKDGTGQVSVFYPFHAQGGAPIQAGSADPLPGTIALDDARGPEWLVAVFSPQPIDVSSLKTQLARTPAGGTPSLRCGGCRISALRIQKP